MRAGRKIAIAVVVVTAVTGYMAYLGVSASWQYYLTVDECIADTAAFRGERIRVSGKIAADSLRITEDRRQATFSLRGTRAALPVACCGPLPDNLAEDVEVVVEGRLQESGLLRGEKVLTRCAGKYKSPAAATPRTAARDGPEDIR